MKTFNISRQTFHLIERGVATIGKLADELERYNDEQESPARVSVREPLRIPLAADECPVPDDEPFCHDDYEPGMEESPITGGPIVTTKVTVHVGEADDDPGELRTLDAVCAETETLLYKSPLVGYHD